MSKEEPYKCPCCGQMATPPPRPPIGREVFSPMHGYGAVSTYDQCADTDVEVLFNEGLVVVHLADITETT